MAIPKDSAHHRRPVGPFHWAGRLALCLLVGAVPAWSVAKVDERAARYYEDALTRYEKRDLKGAVIQLKNALQIDKNMLPVQVLLGRALLAAGDVMAAEVAFSEALRLGVDRAEVVIPLARAVMAQGQQRQLVEQPRFATAGLPRAVQAQLLLLQASAHADLGDSRAAMRSIEQARALEPDSAQSWLAEVSVRVRARQLAEALAAADRALVLAPGNAEALYLRGTVLHSRGDAAGTLDAYAAALRAQPGHVEALVSRAALLLDLRRAADAAAAVEALLLNAPTDPRGYYLSALLAEQAGKTAEARAALNKITALIDPVPIEQLRYRPQALMLVGMAHFGLNQREKAKPYLEMAQRLQPNSGLSKLLAQVYLAERNYERAVGALEAYLKAFPNDAQALSLLASAHMAQGRYARATQLMQDALRGQDDGGLRTMLGISLIASGKFPDAAQALEVAYRKDPTQTRAGLALATLYLQSGQLVMASRTVGELARREPRNAAVQYLLGSVAARQGDASTARKAFEAALRLDPKFITASVALARLDADAKAYSDASLRLTAVLAQDGKNVEALSEQARLAEQMGLMEEAQRWWEKADDSSAPGQLQAGLSLVEFHLRQNKPVAAMEAGKRLIGKDPDSAHVLVAMARIQLGMGDAVTARSTLTRAATLVGYNAPMLLQLALLQVQARDPAGAAYTLGKALTERPDFLPAQALLAEVEIRIGEQEKAEQRINRIVAIHAKLGVGYALRGDLAMSRGQFAAAVNAYRQAHEIEQSTNSLLRLFNVMAAVDPPGAQHTADRWLKLHPSDLAVQSAVANAYARAGNWQSARKAYEALAKATPSDAEVLNNLANVLLLAGDPAALDVANRALALQPARAHIIGTAGYAAYRAGQQDRALQLLRDARLRDPGNPDTRYFLASVLASTGRKAEAKAELESALQAGAGFASAKDAKELLLTLK